MKYVIANEQGYASRKSWINVAQSLQDAQLYNTLAGARQGVRHRHKWLDKYTIEEPRWTKIILVHYAQTQDLTGLPVIYNI